MDDNVNEILGRLPPKPPRSRLDPHAALIEEMRRRGRTYKEISRALAETSQVKSCPSNIYYFLQLRAREARRLKAAQAKQTETGPRPSRKVAPKQTTLGKPGSPRSLPVDVAQRIAEFKNRKAPEPSPTGFDFDPNEPLRLINPVKQKPDD